MRNITKDRYRVIDQLKPLLQAESRKHLHKMDNEYLAELWEEVKGYELRYVGADLFQCEEE